MLLLGAGLMLHLLGFMLVPFPPPASNAVEQFNRPVQWLSDEDRQSQWFQEALVLRNPMSLFYATVPGRDASVKTPGIAGGPIDLRILEVFPLFNPPLDLREAVSPEGWTLQPRVESPLGKPLEWDLKLLTDFFGQREKWIPEELHPSLWAQVRSASSGVVQTEIQLPFDELSPPRSLWENMHFRIQIAPGDLAIPPLLLRGSGDEEFDASVLRLINRMPEIRQLPAGFYELQIFP